MRFGEGGGEEFVAAGLPRLAIAVAAEPVAGAGVDQRGEGRVAGFGPVAREKEGEGDVEMGTDAQGVGELGQEAMEARGESGGKRFERGGPGGGVARRPGRERAQPGPTNGGRTRA